MCWQSCRRRRPVAQSDASGAAINGMIQATHCLGYGDCKGRDCRSCVALGAATKHWRMRHVQTLCMIARTALLHRPFQQLNTSASHQVHLSITYMHLSITFMFVLVRPESFLAGILCCTHADLTSLVEEEHNMLLLHMVTRHVMQ